MSIFVFTNNASSLLASGISDVATTLSVTATQGSLFPAIPAGHIAAITLEDVSNNIEIVYATARTGDSMTILRGQEGTTALPFTSGSRVDMRLTAGVLNAMLQKNGGDTLSGTTVVSGIIDLASGGSIRGGETAGTKYRSQPGDTSNELSIPLGGGDPTLGGSIIVTAANIGNHTPAGSSYVLTNMIVIWAGLSSAVPAGWHVCDGTNGTPDYRDQFIIGGSGIMPVTGGAFTGFTGATDAITGATVQPHVLDITEIPGHTHDVQWGLSDRAATVPNGAGQTFGRVDVVTSASAGGGLGHTHGLTGGGTHSHSVTLPPYRAVLFIMKL